MNDNHYNLYNDNHILTHYHNDNVHDFSLRFIAMTKVMRLLALCTHSHSVILIAILILSVSVLVILESVNLTP